MYVIVILVGDNNVQCVRPQKLMRANAQCSRFNGNGQETVQGMRCVMRKAGMYYTTSEQYGRNYNRISTQVTYIIPIFHTYV